MSSYKDLSEYIKSVTPDLQNEDDKLVAEYAVESFPDQFRREEFDWNEPVSVPASGQLTTPIIYRSKDVSVPSETVEEPYSPIGEQQIKPLSGEELKTASLPTSTDADVAAIQEKQWRPQATVAGLEQRAIGAGKRLIGTEMQKVAPISISPEQTATKAQKIKAEATVAGEAAELVDPTWYRSEKIQERINEIKGQNPNIGNSLEMGDISGATDILVFNAFLGGNDAAKNSAIQTARSVRDVAGERAGKAKKGIGGTIENVVNATAEMLPMMGKSAALSAIPIIGPAITSSMWVQQGAGDVITGLKEEGVEDDVALAYGLLGALPYAAIEQLQIGQLLGTGAKKAVSGSIKKKLAAIAKEKGKDTFKEMAEEGTQAAILESVTIDALKESGIEVDDEKSRIINSFIGDFKASAGPMGILSLLGFSAGAASVRRGKSTKTKAIGETGTPLEETTPKLEIQKGEPLSLSDYNKLPMAEKDKNFYRLSETDQDRAVAQYEEVDYAKTGGKETGETGGQAGAIREQTEGIRVRDDAGTRAIGETGREEEKEESVEVEEPVETAIKPTYTEVSQKIGRRREDVKRVVTKGQKESVESGVSAYQDEILKEYGETRPTKKEVSEKFNISREEAGTRINSVYGKQVDKIKEPEKDGVETIVPRKTEDVDKRGLEIQNVLPGVKYRGIQEGAKAGGRVVPPTMLFDDEVTGSTISIRPNQTAADLQKKMRDTRFMDNEAKIDEVAGKVEGLKYSGKKVVKLENGVKQLNKIYTTKAGKTITVKPTDTVEDIQNRITPLKEGVKDVPEMRKQTETTVADKLKEKVKEERAVVPPEEMITGKTKQPKPAAEVKPVEQKEEVKRGKTIEELRLEEEQKRSSQEKQRRPATVKRTAEDDKYSAEYWKEQHRHELNVGLYNALRYGWIDRNGKERQGKQSGWIDDYNVLTDKSIKKDLKGRSISKNAKDYLQSIVDNINDNQDYIEEAGKIGIVKPEHYDDVIALLQGSKSASEFIRFHEDYEKGIRDENTDVETLNNALEVFYEEPYNITPEQRKVLEDYFQMPLNDALKEIDEDESFNEPGEELKPEEWKQQDIFGGEKSVKEIETEERTRLEKAEIKKRIEDTKGGDADLSRLPMFEDQDIEGSQSTLKFAKKDKEVDKLKKELRKVEDSFDDLRKSSKFGKEWDDREQEAVVIRKKLIELTGDPYGDTKKRTPLRKPEGFDDEYNYPEDVPEDVMEYALKQSLLTSDANDAIRLSRIVNTENDERYDDGDLTIYRAVEPEYNNIRPGDWVTTSKEYAEKHNERYFDGKGKVLEEAVNGKDVLVSPTGNSEEAIYAPIEMSGGIKKITKFAKKEEDKNLVGLHNLDSGKLIHADKLGGIAMPSIAVTKKNVPFDSFGDITLISKKGTVDPKNRLSKTFDADIYSPRYPKEKRKYDKVKLKEVYEPLAVKYKNEIQDDSSYGKTVRDNAGNKYGQTDYVMWQVDNDDKYFRGDPIIAMAFLDSKGIDYEKTKSGILDKSYYNSELRSELDDFTEDFLDKGTDKKVFFKGYTYSGSKRYKDYNLDNIVGEMKKNLRGGEGFNYGAGNIRAQIAKKFTSIKDIKKGSERIRPDVEKEKDEFNSRLFDIASKISHTRKNGNEFISVDNVTEGLSEGIKRGNIKAELESYGFTVTESDMSDIFSFLNDLRNAPTEYFESKVSGIMKISDFAGAVIPNTSSQKVKDILNKNGIEFVEYDKSVNGDRQKKINEFKTEQEIFFSKKEPNETEGREQKVSPVQKGRTEEEKKIIDAIYREYGKKPNYSVLNFTAGGKVQEELADVFKALTGDPVQFVSVDQQAIQKDGIDQFDGFRHNGTIYLNISGPWQRPLLWTAFHEWYHGLTDNERKFIEQAASVTDAGWKRISDKGNDEFFADIAGEIMSRPETLEYMAKENPVRLRKIIQKLIDTINTLVEKFKRLITGDKRVTYTKYITNAEAIRDRLVTVLEKRMGKDMAVEMATVFSYRQKTDPFFSPLLKAVQNLKQQKGTGEQMFNMLTKTPGVKEAEWKWMGLDDFLKGKKSVTRQEVEDFVLENQVQIKEVTKDKEGKSNDEENGVSKSEGPKYSEYQLLGGENYREVLLTLPKQYPAVDLNKRHDRVLTTADGKWSIVTGDNGKYSIYNADGTQISTEQETLEDAKKLVRTYYSAAPIFKSSHWDEPNVFVHTRLDDRTGPNGEKVLFVEEIQSDWEREAREKGVSLPLKQLPENWKVVHEYQGGDRWGNKQNPRDERDFKSYKIYDENGTLVNGHIDKDIAIEVALSSRIGRIPNQPFLKNWQEVVLKRILRMAAEEGYDRVAWINGSQTADRYDLSKQIKEVKAGKRDETFGTYRITAKGNNEENVIDEQVLEDNLSGAVGKDLAKKIVEENGGTYSGLDLKIGGEWATALYDRMIPKFYEKYGKKFNSKIESVELPEIGTQQSIRITPEMANSVLYEGQPMFSKREKIVDDATTPNTTFYQIGDVTERKKELRKKLGKIKENLLDDRIVLENEIKKLDEKNRDRIAASIIGYAQRIGLRGEPYNRVDVLVKNVKTAKGFQRAIEVMDNVMEKRNHRRYYKAAKEAISDAYSYLKKIEGKVRPTTDLETNRALKSYLDTISGEISETTRKAKLMAEYYSNHQDDDIKANRDVYVEELGEEIVSWIDESKEDVPEQAQKYIAALSSNGLEGMSNNALVRVIRDIKTIRKTGRTIKQLQDNKERLRIEEATKKIVAAVKVNSKDVQLKTPVQKATGSVQEAEKRRRFSIKNAGNMVYSALETETILERVAGTKGESTLKTEVFNPMYKAVSTEKKNLKNAIDKFHERYSGIDISFVSHEPLITIEVDGYDENNNLKKTDLTLTYNEGMYFYAMSMNDSQREALIWTLARPVTEKDLDGNKDLYNEQKDAVNEEKHRIGDALIDEVVNALPEEYKDLVRKQWAYYKNEQHSRINSEYVKVHGIDMPSEEYYFPISRDFNSASNMINIDLMERMGFRKAKVSGKFTISRVASRVPIKKFDYFGTVIGNMLQAEHYIAFNEPVNNVRRILNNPDVHDEIYSYNPEAWNNIDDWLKALTYGRSDYGTREDWTSKAIKRVRKNSAVFQLGFKATAIMIQSTSYFRGMSQVKHKYIAKSWGELAKAIREGKVNEYFKVINDLSPIMASREQDSEQILQEWFEAGIADKILKTEKAGQRLKNKAMKPMSLYDKFIAAMIWKAKFDEVMNTVSFSSEKEATDKAVYEADKVVRRTQSGGGMLTSTGMQRGAEWQRMYTQYASDSIKGFNMLVSFFDHFNEMDIKEKAAIIGYGFILPAIVANFIRSGFKPPWEEPEEVAIEAVKSFSDGLPLVGTITNTIAVAGTDKIKQLRGKPTYTYYDYVTDPNAPVIGIVEDAATSIKEGVIDHKFYKAVGVAGQALGIPGGAQATRTIKEGKTILEGGNIGRLVFGSRADREFDLVMRYYGKDPSDSKKNPELSAKYIKWAGKQFKSWNDDKKGRYRKYVIAKKKEVPPETLERIEREQGNIYSVAKEKGDKQSAEQIKEETKKIRESIKPDVKKYFDNEMSKPYPKEFNEIYMLDSSENMVDKAKAMAKKDKLTIGQRRLYIKFKREKNGASN